MTTETTAPEGVSSFYVDQATKALAALGKLSVAFEYECMSMCSRATFEIETMLAEGKDKEASKLGWTKVRQVRRELLPFYLVAVSDELESIGVSAEAFQQRFIDAQIKLSSNDKGFDEGFRTLMGIRSEVYTIRKGMLSAERSLQRESYSRTPFGTSYGLSVRDKVSIRRPGVTARQAAKSARNKANRAERGEESRSLAKGGGAGSKQGKK